MSWRVVLLTFSQRIPVNSCDTRTLIREFHVSQIEVLDVACVSSNIQHGQTDFHGRHPRLVCLLDTTETGSTPRTAEAERVNTETNKTPRFFRISPVRREFITRRTQRVSKCRAGVIRKKFLGRRRDRSTGTAQPAEDDQAESARSPARSLMWWQRRNAGSKVRRAQHRSRRAGARPAIRSSVRP